jgi:DNA-binding transcriptional ArsR family regulator
MSIDAYKWAWQQSFPDPTRKLVLLALADHADVKGQCWPGIESLAKKCDVTPRTIRRHLRLLEEAEKLRREYRFKPSGTPMSNRYHLNIATVSPASPSDSDDREVETDTSEGTVAPASSESSYSESTRNPHPKSGELFNHFWEKYPRKQKKQAALKEWNALVPNEELIREILIHEENQLNCPDWTKDGGRFIPQPANYLKERRWEDGLYEEPEPVTPW